MSNELIHGSVGTTMTQAEFEAVGLHVLNSQATGDLIYASSATQLTRLGIGTANKVLMSNGTIPIWQDEEFQAILLKGANILHIPTNAGWTESNVNGGNSFQISQHSCYTSVTASSQGMAWGYFYGFNPAADAGQIRWDKKLYLILNYGRYASDTQAVARFQIKQAITAGALAAKGIGLRVDSLALIGESYGTELGEVDLGIAVTSGYGNQIVILHDPSVPKIEWYVDGVLKGTQSTAAKIPSGNGTATAALMHSIINGVAGGVNAYSTIMQPRIWQAR